MEALTDDKKEEGEEQEEGDDDKDDGLECAPLYVSGLINCTEWKGETEVYGLLSLKRKMLQGVLNVLEDPKSCGEDGDPAKPLLLVQKLAMDEADAIMGASSRVFGEKATDAGGWSPELGGMNRWLSRYYKDCLLYTSPSPRDS